MTTEEKNEHTNKLVEGITRLLKIYLINMEVDLLPEITLKPVVNWKNTLEIQEVVNCADQTIDLALFPEGVKTKRRKREVIIRRQLVFYICRKMGYGFEKIGDAMGFDHATVIHGNRTVAQLIEVGDRDMRGAYNEVTALLREYYKQKYGKDLSTTESGWDNP